MTEHWWQTAVNDDERMLVALNLGDEPAQGTFVGRKVLGDLVLSTCGDRKGEALNGSLDLRAHEGAIFRLSASSDLPAS
jgi:alpha-glucosidase